MGAQAHLKAVAAFHFHEMFESSAPVLYHSICARQTKNELRLQSPKICFVTRDIADLGSLHNPSKAEQKAVVQGQSGSQLCEARNLDGAVTSVLPRLLPACCSGTTTWFQRCNPAPCLLFQYNKMTWRQRCTPCIIQRITLRLGPAYCQTCQSQDQA